ncbi:MAG: hypothetical protein GY820_10765, partial [Gammaproteobacteria bacterium]|nr:hypothetical protein [Gammaproteobacteria bacterium]
MVQIDARTHSRERAKLNCAQHVLALGWRAAPPPPPWSISNGKLVAYVVEGAWCEGVRVRH